MRSTASVVPAIAMVAFCTVALPASADQHRDRRGHDGNGGAGSARTEERRAPEARSREARGGETRGREARGGETQRRSEAMPRGRDDRGPGTGGVRREERRGNDDRGRYDRNDFDHDRRDRRDYRDNRGYRDYRDYRRDYGFRSPWYGRYDRGRWNFGFYFGGLSVGFYSFRPHVSLGFGLWSGYPMAFPHSAYLYSRSSVYSAVGGVSFEVSPRDARVFVDGFDAGYVGDYGPFSRPLSLQTGWHHIEVVASGYRTAVFDVDVQPGQLIPYRGQLEFGERF
jgi:hypothetical protein